MNSATALRADLIDLVTQPFQPANDDTKVVVAEKVGLVWDAIVAGTIPNGTVVVPFTSTFDAPGGKVSRDLVYAAVLGRDYARVDFCLASDGELVVAQLDVFISADKGTMQPLVDEMASHCPVEQRVADAALTDAAFEAIARGETPAIEPMSVAAACGIVRCESPKPSGGHLTRMRRNPVRRHPSGRPRRS